MRIADFKLRIESMDNVHMNFKSIRSFALTFSLPFTMLAFASLLSGCSQRHYVTVIDRTLSIHRAECVRAQMAKVRCTEVTPDILARYKVCPLCKPDVSL